MAHLEKNSGATCLDSALHTIVTDYLLEERCSSLQESSEARRKGSPEAVLEANVGAKPCIFSTHLYTVYDIIQNIRHVRLSVSMNLEQQHVELML